MDFHRMKRKELQTLCKRHGIPANLTNREMADRLASIYKENEKSVSSEKLRTTSEEIGTENEARVVKKQSKKVRFSPENQTFEYEVSAYLRPKRSRKPLLSRNPAQAIENAPNCEDARKVEDCRVRVTRSRVQNAVEEYVNLVFSPLVGRKRRRGDMKNRDAKVNNIGKSKMLEMGEREDVKNGHDRVTVGLTGRQLRSRKNVNWEELTMSKGKGGDVVHLFDEISEESDVREDAKTNNGRKQPMRNARKEDQSVKLSSELEKVEVVSRMTRQSRAQPKDTASIVKIEEVKTVVVEGGCAEVLQLKEPRKGKGKNALSENAVPQRVSAESSLLAVGGSAVEKPLRRSKRNAENDCAKSATSLRNETQETVVQEQSERDLASEEPTECLRRFSSRRKSVTPQSGKGGNKEGLSKKETKKRSRTTELDAIVEHSGEIERANCASTLQDQALFGRSKRRTVILNPPAVRGAESANKEDIDKMQQLRAPYLVRDVTEEFPKMSCQNSSRCSLSGTPKEGQMTVANKNQGVKQQMQEPSLEEEKTSVVDHHPVTEKPQRRSYRLTSMSVSTARCSPTAKVVEKRQPSNPRIEIIQEEAALTESLPAPGELPAGKDELVLTEDSGNKNDLDLNCSDQAVKNADGCSNEKRKGLRGNSGAKKQCGFVEASPLCRDMEEFKDSAGNMEESLITTSEKLIGLSTDQYMQQSTHKYMVVEEGNNLLRDDRERMFHGDNVELGISCMPSPSVNTTRVLDDVNCSDPKFLELESNFSHAIGYTEINFPAGDQGCGICDQQIKEDFDTYSAYESLVVYKEDRSRVNDKQRLIQVDSTDNEMNNPQSSWSLNGRGAVDDSNLLESRQVEPESNIINMDSSEITSLADQRDLTGAISTLLNLENELETKPPRGENTNFLSDNVNAGDGRTFGEAHILVELKDTDFTAAESISEAIFKDPPETSGLKGGPENTPKKAEEMNATDFSSREGIPHMEISMKATENQGSSVEFHFATAETSAQKIIELQHSSYSNIAAPETPCGPAPRNLFKDKICRVEVADTIRIGTSDQERSDDLNQVNAHFIHESALIYEENTMVVENDEEIRIHDDTSDGEMKYQSCSSFNRTGAMDDSNMVEPRMVDSESNGSEVVSPGITSLANVFSSPSQADLAGKTSSRIELEKELETGEPSEKMKFLYCDMDAEGSQTPIQEDQIKLQQNDAHVMAADSIGEVIFNDLLNELGETIGFKRGSEIPLKKSEKQSATECSDGEGVALTESSINATEKHEYRAQIYTAITGTPNITEIKWSSNSYTATCKAVFASAQHCQDKSCNSGNTVNVARSEICNQDEETNLVEDDKEILIQDDNIEGQIKYQPCLPMNKTGALDDALVEPRIVDLESNANKVICSEITFLADICSSASQANFAGETSNELKLEKVSESEESPRRENNYEINKIEDEDEKSSAQKEQNSMHLEDACTNAAELVQEVVSWDHLNETCESYGPKELEISLRKAEETSSDDSSQKGMAQTESSLDINEKSEANVEIHTLAAETGEKPVMEMNWRESSHDSTLISPLRLQVGSQDLQGTFYKVETAVSSAGYGVCGHQENEENVKLEANEHDETINSEKDLFFSGKEIFEESSEGNFLVGGACYRFSNSTGRQCAKDKKVDISDGRFYNVSGEREEKHISKVLVEEGTDPVSSEGKDIYIFESVSPQYLCIDKLSLNGYLLVGNDMQENSEVLNMDNKNTRNEVQASILPQLALERLDNESEAGKQVAENGEANAVTISNATQALPSEDLTTPIISEPFSMRPLDHELVDRVRNSSGDRVMDHPLNNDYAATIGISASRETDVGQDDNIMDEIEMWSLNVVLADQSGCKLGSTESSEEIENASMISRVPFVKSNYGDLDDQGEEVALQRVCSSSIGLDGPKSTDGIIVDSIPKVGTLESTLNSIGNDPQSATKADDPDVNESNAANEFEDGRKAAISHQSPLHGGKQEDVPSYADKRCGKRETGMASSTLLCSSIPVSREKELNPQVMDDMKDVGGAEISIDFEVTREEREWFQINTGGFSDVTDGSLVDFAEAKSDDCEGSVKTATFMDGPNSLAVNQPVCLNESKNCDLEEPHGLHLHNKIADDSGEVGTCDKLDIFSSMEPKTVTDCSSFSSIRATCDQHYELENLDESDILINMNMSLFSAVEDEFKKPDANAGDSNHSALDKTISGSNLSNLKEENYVASADVEDVNFSVTKDGPEDIEGTMELRKDVPGLVEAMAKKSPLTKNSDGRGVVEREEASASELNLILSQKKKTSKTVSVKQLSSSIMKSKGKSSLIQRTPKRLIIHDMKENELSTKIKRTTPKTSSKRRPLDPVRKC